MQRKKRGRFKKDGALELKRSKWGQNPSFHLAQERLPKYRFSSQVPDNLHYLPVLSLGFIGVLICNISGAPMTVNPFCWRFRLQRANTKKTPRGRCGRRHGRVVQQEFVGGGIVK